MAFEKNSKRRGCDHKSRYPSKAVAERYRWKLINATGASHYQINSYQCRLCGFWHLGHPPLQARVNRRNRVRETKKQRRRRRGAGGGAEE